MNGAEQKMSDDGYQSILLMRSMTSMTSCSWGVLKTAHFPLSYLFMNGIMLCFVRVKTLQKTSGITTDAFNMKNLQY